MAHVFVAPHPDDVALSCGGPLPSLRELSQKITMLTVSWGGGEGQLLGAIRDDDRAPMGQVRREMVRLEPLRAYLPFPVDNHVDHRWKGCDRLEDLPPGSLTILSPAISLVPACNDIRDVLERKTNGTRLYQNQLGRHSGGERQMDEAVRSCGAKAGRLGVLDGAAEHGWASARP